MTTRPTPGSFEDFLRWLHAGGDRPPASALQVPAEVRSAAEAAWRAMRDSEHERLAAIAQRLATSAYEEDIDVLAAADADRGRWLPRLRTPNGFAISALYPTEPAAEAAAPVGLLVECPADLVELCRGRLVHISVGDRWIEIGEIDRDGKVVGDLPPGLEFKPPFAFRVGVIAETADPLESPDPP
jgi:hypothetical protein